MWNALENIALRESLPTPLAASESVHGILISGQLNRGRYNLHHVGRRRSKPYLLKQFYSIDTDAFLAWQNEARLINLPQIKGYAWPCEEWRGGLISPFPAGMPLIDWLQKHTPDWDRTLRIAHDAACLLAQLHASGIAHRNLSLATLWTNGEKALIANFGHAYIKGWDDFWTDAAMTARSVSCASPNLLNGTPDRTEEDIHALGAVLYSLLIGKPAFGPVKRALRPLFPHHVTPNGLPKFVAMPRSVREIIAAALSTSPEYRPTISEVISVLGPFADQPTTALESFKPGNETPAPKNKIMVFVGNDSHAVSLFDEAIHTADRTPSQFLFVGLIPNNLPSGHAERFKGNILRKLGQGLMRCRAANVLWSLRLIHAGDPEKAATELVRQYRPTQVFLGETDVNHPFRNSGFHSVLEQENTEIISIV